MQPSCHLPLQLRVAPTSPVYYSHPVERDTPYEACEDALKAWSVGHTEPPPPVEVAHCQKAWDVPRVNAAFKAIQDAAPDATTQARLLAACRKESGAWLHALPIASLGLCMDDKVVRVAMGLCPGTALCYPHECHLCGARVDSRETHGLHCRKSLGRHPRHMAIMTSSRGPWLQPRSRHTWNQQGYADQIGRDQTGNCNAMEEQRSPCLGRHLPGHLCSIPLAAGHPRGKCSGRPS